MRELLKVDESVASTTAKAAPHTADFSLLRLYRWMRTARRIDELERELIARGEAFFHVGAAGHEASACLAPLLTADDYLHCHYRDKALMLARGLPVREFFDSLLCNAASHSAGRQMSAHLSAPALKILSVVGPVGNNALQAVGVAQQIADHIPQPIVLCSLGDGSTQQGEVLEAIAEAVRSTLPVLFLVHDNRYSISTRTAGQTFFSLPTGSADTFYGLPIHRLDGTDVESCRRAFGPIVEKIRRSRGPAICVMAVERLTDHTNADDESVYRKPEEISRARLLGDPLEKTRLTLLSRGVAPCELERLHEAVNAVVQTAAQAALEQPAPVALAEPAASTYADSATYPGATFDPARTVDYTDFNGHDFRPELTMAEALRETLRARMTRDPRVTLFGQDIEDPKGDVFGVTRGLSTAFAARVRNAPLSESTIVGTSIGRALAGGRPVAFLQFADFLPLAFNQIATELASMAWRTQGGWRAPVILMVSCGAYRPGLGPFHAHTFDALLAHLPGIDVVMPSSATDAAGALNAAFQSERPTVILYPKALLHSRLKLCTADVQAQLAPVGAARVRRAGADITLVGWGNTVALCEKAAEALSDAGKSAEVIDLRWLAPWDRAAVIRSVSKTRKLLVVHEDNLSGGFGAEVVAATVETIGGEVPCRRVARPDTFVPCHFGNQLDVLPSFRRTLEVAASMLRFSVRWEFAGSDADEDAQAARTSAPQQMIYAIGSSPADQTLEIVELPVTLGQSVVTGQTVACLEADKAVVEMASPADGVVTQLHVRVGDRVPVDTPLMTLSVARARQRQPNAERHGIPHLTPRSTPSPARSSTHTVMLQGLGTVRGSLHLHNRELAPLLPSLAAADGHSDGIFARTGIESRTVAGPEQDAVSMAVEAARRALADAGVGPEELSLVICSTSTPTMISPSTACQVLHLLAPGCEMPAYDVQAACSGYLYALAQAWDFLQQRPQSHVLVLTTEVMRSIINIRDPQTSPIFGDAATATVLSTYQAQSTRALATLRRPCISARGDDGSALRVPLPGIGSQVHMDGKRIFTEAVRCMSAALDKACADAGVAPSDLDMLVPHQANGRIIEAIRARLKMPVHKVWNEIRQRGNTSSSSIPLALDTMLRSASTARRIGICAFGAGFTSGAALLVRQAGETD